MMIFISHLPVFLFRFHFNFFTFPLNSKVVKFLLHDFYFIALSSLMVFVWHMSTIILMSWLAVVIFVRLYWLRLETLYGYFVWKISIYNLYIWLYSWDAVSLVHVFVQSSLLRFAHLAGYGHGRKMAIVKIIFLGWLIYF